MPIYIYSTRNRNQTGAGDRPSFAFAELGASTAPAAAQAPAGWFQPEAVVTSWVDRQFTETSITVWYDPQWTVAGTPPPPTQVLGWWGNQDYATLPVSRRHTYQDLFFVAIPPPPPTQVLGWWGNQDYVPPILSRRHVYQDVAFVPFRPQVLGWWGNQDYVPRAPGRAAPPFDAYTTFVPSPAAPITGWFSNFDPVPRSSPSRAQFDWFTTFGRPPIVTLGWGATFPDWIARAARSVDFPSFTYGATPIVTPFGWTPVYVDFALRRPGSPDIPFLAWAPQPIAAPIVVMGWLPVFPDWIARAARSPDFPAAQPFTAIAPQVLGWWGSQDFAPLPSPSRRHDYQSYAFVQIPPLITGWRPTYVDFVWRKLPSPDFPFLSWPAGVVKLGPISGVLLVNENLDVFFGLGQFYNQPVRVKVGLVEKGPQVGLTEASS